MRIVIEDILQLKTVILVSGIGILLLGAFFLVVTRRFDWERKNVKIIGFFYEMNSFEITGLALSLLKMLFIISLAVGLCNVQKVQIMYFAVLLAISVFFKRGLRSIVIYLCSSVVMTATLFVMSLLHGYLTEIIMDWKIVVFLILLILFLFLYSIYDIFQTVNLIAEGRLSKERKEEESES